MKEQISIQGNQITFTRTLELGEEELKVLKMFEVDRDIPWIEIRHPEPQEQTAFWNLVTMHIINHDEDAWHFETGTLNTELISKEQLIELINPKRKLKDIISYTTNVFENARTVRIYVNDTVVHYIELYEKDDNYSGCIKYWEGGINPIKPKNANYKAFTRYKGLVDAIICRLNNYDVEDIVYVNK